MTKKIVLLTDIRYEAADLSSDFVKNIFIEDKLLQNELQNLGYKVERAAWDSQKLALAPGNIAVFRSTWNYFHKIDHFQSWLSKYENIVKFINPISVIKWNLDKRYLFDLEKNGVDIPETILVKKGSIVDLADMIKVRNWQKIVIKPAISASAYNTFMLADEEIGSFTSKFNELLQQDTFLIQEFQENILTNGEVSMVFINGEFTHAVLKMAKPGDYRVQDDFGGTVQKYIASPYQVELGEQTIKACSETPVYARVDIIINNQQKWVVSELELVEPELWMRLHPECARRLASAIDNYVS